MDVPQRKKDFERTVRNEFRDLKTGTDAAQSRAMEKLHHVTTLTICVHYFETRKNLKTLRAQKKGCSIQSFCFRSVGFGASVFLFCFSFLTMIFESTKSNVYTLLLNEIIIYPLKNKKCLNNFVNRLVCRD